MMAILHVAVARPQYVPNGYEIYVNQQSAAAPLYGIQGQTLQQMLYGGGPKIPSIPPLYAGLGHIQQIYAGLGQQQVQPQYGIDPHNGLQFAPPGQPQYNGYNLQYGQQLG